MTVSEEEDFTYPEEEISKIAPVRGDQVVSQSEERSVMSKRSDELSIRSASRRVGGNYKQEKMPVIVGILTVIVFILGGAVLFAVWEGWNIFDGAYFSFITLTTIGNSLTFSKQNTCQDAICI